MRLFVKGVSSSLLQVQELIGIEQGMAKIYQGRLARRQLGSTAGLGQRIQMRGVTIAEHPWNRLKLPIANRRGQIAVHRIDQLVRIQRLANKTNIIQQTVKSIRVDIA